MNKNIGASSVFVGTLIAVAGLGRIARADMIAFDNQCGDMLWHTCCDCMENMKCNNWLVPATPAPICPALPTGSDNVMIEGDCTLEADTVGSVLTLSQYNGTFTLDGTLSVADTAVFEGPVVWNSGAMSRGGGAAGQQVACNGELTIQGDDPKTLSFLGGLRLINTATGSWRGAGDWTIGMIPGACCPSIFENAAGATFDVQNNASIFHVSYGVGVMENHGTLIKSSSGLSEWAVNLSNTGTVHVEDGELRLTRAGAIGGTWTIDPGAEVGFAGNNFTLEAGVIINGRAVVKDSGNGNGIDINDDVTIDDLTIATDGRLGGTGTLSIRGTLVNEADPMTNEAGDPNVHMHVLPGGTLEAQGTNALMGQVDVEGEMHLPAGAATGCFNQLLTVMPGGIVTVDDGATLNQTGLVSQPIDNHGTIRKPATPGTATISNYFNRSLNNQADGTISVPGGVLRCVNVLEAYGNIDIAAGAEYVQEGWAHYYAGATVTGEGYFHIKNAQNNFVDAGANLVVQRFRMSGSSNGLGGDGELTITDRGDLQGGYLTTSMATFAPGSIVSVSGPNFTGGASVVVENHGTLELVNQSFGFNQFNNRSDGTIDIQADFAFLNWFTNGPCTNEGLLVKSGGAGNSDIVCSVTNTGTVRAESGRMTFPNAINTLTQNNGVTELAGGEIAVKFLTLNGGILRGAGNLSANVNNTGGSVEPGTSPGVLNIQGNTSPAYAGDYTQGTGGTLVIEVGGLDAGTQHDQLVVAGTANLGGTLEVRQYDNFVPMIGDSITVLTATSVVNEFDSIVLTGFPANLDVMPTYNPTSVLLTFVPGTASPADMNCDGNVDGLDVQPFLLAVLDSAGYASAYPACDIDNGDLDESGVVDAGDVSAFVAVLIGS